jgi:hypothetical protein
MAKAKIELGARVGFSAAFLRSTGQFAGRVPHLRGEVIELEDFGAFALARVAWQDGAESRVNVKNLARVGSLAMYD